MNTFELTELEGDERIVFGPVTSIKTTTISGGQGLARSSVSKSSGRTVGITNRRIIIEDLQNPARSKVIPNERVQRVYIKHKGATITITKVQTASEAVKVNLPGIGSQGEHLLASTFPNAEIVTGGGIPKWVFGAIGAVVGLVVLGCLVMMFASKSGSKSATPEAATGTTSPPAATAVPTPALQAYTNATADYSLLHPIGWYKVEDAGRVSFAESEEAYKSPALEAPLVTVIGFPLSQAIRALEPGQEPTPARFLAFIAEQLQAEIGEIKDMPVDGYPGAIATTSGVMADVPYSGNMVAVVTDDLLLIVDGVAPTEQWDAFQPVFLDLANSVTFPQ